MIRKFLSTFILALILVFLCIPVNPVKAKTISFSNTTVFSETPWPAPEGFAEVLSEPGVILFRKDYPNGTPDYVQVIFLDQGARVSLLYAGLDQKRPGRGVFGGDDARFNLESLKGFWVRAVQKDKNVFCVSNGGFFYMPETPTRLPYSLKIDGVILTDGYGEEQNAEQRLMLELWEDRADILPLNGENLYRSNAPNIIAGLTVEANKRAKYAVGRTMVGVQDRDADNKFDTVFLLNTQTHTQTGAAQVLKNFGAQKVMMLDGGGSTQLICQGKEYIATGRLFPQALAVFAGEGNGHELLQAEILPEKKEDLQAGLTNDSNLLSTGDDHLTDNENENNIEPSLIRENDEQASSLKPEKISLKGLLLVPTIILPLGLVFFLFFSWLRRWRLTV